MTTLLFMELETYNYSHCLFMGVQHIISSKVASIGSSMPASFSPATISPVCPCVRTLCCAFAQPLMQHCVMCLCYKTVVIMQSAQ